MSKSRNSKMPAKVLVGAIALALATVTVQAGTTTGKAPTKEEKIGMASGAAIGALIAGPFGAAVGFIVGTVGGATASKYDDAKKTAKTLEQQLAGAQQELAQLANSKADDKAASDAKLETIYEQFAQRLHADVLFRTASSDLDPSSAAKLSDLGKVLGAYPDLIIDVDGYADPRGKSASNDELSQQRAMAVRAALIVGGLSPDRVHVAAHGEKLSTAMKDDLEAYAWERRVSLSVRPASVAQQKGGQVAQAK